ncbi:hypothetical protein SNE40_007517 [Patella caerulea]|uniref:CBM21 domain-containing protein n=1 Tax=Patella caerulea TaxID=87958 RepID=A0AAN8K4R6_PATCE
MDWCTAGNNTRVLLPRNLSYSQDSLLDNFSVCSKFVFNRKKEKYEKSNHRGNIRMAEAHMDGPVVNAGGISGKIYHRQTSSGDSQESEEGIYVNMSDDLDSAEDSANETSESKANTSADSMFSPDENNDDLGLSPEGHSVDLEKAVNKIAIGMQPNPELRIDLCDRPNEGSRQSIYDLISDSPVYEDSEFNFSRAELRKSSSLKTNKTPPGTPRRKKAVRFADAMGLDLEDVRHILNVEAPPKIPASAMKDLRVGVENDRQTVGTRFLSACFSQPGAAANFKQRVMAEKVCLENAVITDMTITGVVRVANIGFHKAVRIRFSTNNWVSFHDIAASYVINSCDGPTDRFSFSIVAPMELGVGSRLEFAVSYTVGETVYWDNNFSANYVFECFAKTIPTENDSYWMHFL